MGKKRDYIAEILDIKGRLFSRKSIDIQLRNRVFPIVNAFHFLKHYSLQAERGELLKYIPIGYVACIEGYSRLVLKEFIDAGSPYIERITGFDEIKIILSDIPPILKKEITIGEYVSHLIPLNNLQDINRAFSIITGSDFLSELKKIDYYFNESGQKEKFKSCFLTENKIDDLKSLFETRHIYAHELASKKKIGTIKIKNMIAAGAGLLLSLQTYAYDKLNKTV